MDTHSFQPAPLLNKNSSRSRNSLALAGGLLLTGLLGAGQLLMLVFIAGEGPAADALLAAYAMYTPFAIFGISLRRTLVPLLGSIADEETLRTRASHLIARTRLLACTVGAILLCLSPLLVYVVAGGLPDGAQSTTLAALWLLIPAGVIQVYAGAMSATMNAARRFSFSIAAYVAAAATALLLAAALLPRVGVLGTAVGILLGAVVLSTTHWRRLARSGIRPPVSAKAILDRRQLHLAFYLLGGAAIPVAQQLGLTVAVSVVSHYPSGIMVYTYAFAMVGLMLNISALPLAFAALPDIVDELARRGLQAAENQVLTLVPCLFAILVPMLVAFVALGEPVLELILGSGLTSENIRRIHDVATILTGMVFLASLAVLATTCLLAMHRWRTAIYIGVASVGAHLLAIAVLLDSSVEMAAVGHVVATGCTTVLLFASVFGSRALPITFTALRCGSPAFALSGVFALAAVLIDKDSPAWLTLLAMFVSTAVYVALVALTWRTVRAPFLRVFRG